MTDSPAHGQPDAAGGQLIPRGPAGVVAYPDQFARHSYPQGVPDGEPGLAHQFFYFLDIVLKRRMLVASSVLLLVVLGAAYAFLQTPLYHATVRIQIDRESAKVIKGDDVAPSDGSAIDYMRTQLELLKSFSLAERVAASTRVFADASFFTPRGLFGAILSRAPDQDDSVVTRQRKAALIVQDRIHIKPVAGSRIVDITYVDAYAPRAQRVANAVADAYIASTLDKRFEANAYAKSFLEDQIAQLKVRVEESERALLEFAEREKIIQVSERASNAENNLAAANAALSQIITGKIKAEELWKQVENSKGFALPQLLSNAVIDGLRQRRNQLDTEYQEKLQTFKPNYPDMLQIANKIKEIDRQLAVEVRQVRDALKGAYTAALNQEKEMSDRIQLLNDEVLDLQKRSIRYNTLRREVDTNSNLYNSLLQRYKEVDIAGGVGSNNVFIVDRAALPVAPSEPKHLRIILLCLVLGLLIGIGIAYVLELVDDTVHGPDQLEEVSGMVPLGVIPIAETDDNVMAQLNEPRSNVAEAYRSLATALQFSTSTGLPRSIAVTSSGPGEGKSSTCVALARHFAMMGLNVLLVDADLRKPTLHVKLGLDNSAGLSNYLIGSMSPPQVIQATQIPNLAFIASGPLPPNAADLFSGPRLFSLVSVGLEVFDLIIIDSPPMLGLADAPLLANAASTTVFVVGAGQARKGAIRLGLRRLQLSRANIIGCVMTKFNVRKAGYAYGSNYGYGSGYGYGGDAYTYGHADVAPQSSAGQLTRG